MLSYAPGHEGIGVAVRFMTSQSPLDRPIRVVVFGGGPTLELGLKQLLIRLEEHFEIQFVGAFIESPDQSLRAVVRDLWRRRGLLAAPLLVMSTGQTIARYLTRPRHQRLLHRRLSRLSDRLHYIADLHAAEVAEEVQRLEPDLGLIYGGPILKPSLFEIPARGTLGIHHGKVPEYRGKKTTFWAMFNGEKTAGVTIQRVNEGIDTGEIIRIGEVPIGRRRLGSVWRELEALGVDLYIDAIVAIRHGSATFHPQSGPRGKLYRDPKLRDILALWARYLLRRIKTPHVESQDLSPH
jgi:folate-dependent phosphoribosylglycinamide formyltransferase PurN